MNTRTTVSIYFILVLVAWTILRIAYLRRWSGYEPEPNEDGFGFLLAITGVVWPILLIVELVRLWLRITRKIFVPIPKPQLDAELIAALEEVERIAPTGPT